MIPTLYQGSVKDVLGPVDAQGRRAVIFDYTDAFSVFDWGRMPDELPGKGQALAVIAAHLFEQLERSDSWKLFRKTGECQALLSSSPFGKAFEEAGQALAREGLRTHYLGVQGSGNEAVGARSLSGLGGKPISRIVVRQVSVVKPRPSSVLGRAVPDYSATRAAPFPKLVPLEVIFRFSCPPGSSLLKRIQDEPGYLAARGFAGYSPGPGAKWEFPVLELFSKLESSDRPVGLIEAVAISGISPEGLQEILLKTAWVAGWLKALLAREGLELADGKLEWGIGEDGSLFLVDAIGPDELRILKNGVQLSKEFLRAFYRDSAWYKAVTHAKELAEAQGTEDWASLVKIDPPRLPADRVEAASQLYRSLAHVFTGEEYFPGTWPVDELVKKLAKLGSGK